MSTNSSPFKTLNNMQKTFAFSRTLSIIVVLCATVATIAVSVYCLNMVRREREKIYVLDRGRSLILALQQDLSANRPVEARDHVRMFHTFFFSLPPDNEAIRSNIQRALDLSDKSAYNYYVDLAEAGFYRRLMSTNTIQSIAIDSIVCNVDTYPYAATTHATITLLRDSRVSRRSLVSTCELVNVPRSDANPHGFLLQNYVIVENKDLENENR